MNVRNGDILTIGGQTLTVRGTELYDWPYSTCLPLATKVCQISRPGKITAGKRAVNEVIYEEVSCMPIDPLDGETIQRLQLESPINLKQTILIDPYDTSAFTQVYLELLVTG